MTLTEPPVSQRRLGRDLALWFGSFLLAAVALVVYFRAPIVPLVLAGGLTLAITVVRHRHSAQKKRPL